MCTKTDAKRLIEEAMILEQANSKEARKKLLEASEIMLYQSTQDKTNEDKYLLIANKCFERAERLKSSDNVLIQTVHLPLPFHIICR